MKTGHFALQVLRGVLHSLRDRLMIDQSAHLSAQLLLLIRRIYFENWDPQPLPSRDRTVEDFDHVRPALTDYPGAEFIDAVSAVFEVLQRHVSWGGRRQNRKDASSCHFNAVET